MRPNPDPAPQRARTDAIVVVAGALGVWLTAARFDLFERFIDWVHAHEAWEVDEVTVVMTYLTIAFAVFIVRRWYEARQLITAHREVVKRLAHRETELSATMEAMPDPLFRFDPTGRILEARQEVLDTSTWGGLVGRSITEVMPRTQAEQVLSAIGRVSTTGEAVEEPFEFPKWAGHEHWEVRFVPVGNGDVLAVTRDFTRLRNQERQTAALAERFGAAFEAAASGVALLDLASGAFATINPSGATMLGSDSDGLVGATLATFVHPDDRPQWTRAITQLRSGATTSATMKLRFERRDGSSLHGVVTVARIADPSGSNGELIVQVIDISAQEEAQQQLVELLASKDQFIASVSHELRTPLTAVVGFAEMLRDSGDLDAAEQTLMISAIADQSRDMAYMIEDLLVGARIDSDSLTLLTDLVDLTSEAEQVMDVLAGSATDVRSTCSEPAVALGDPTRVRQILRNLITNAARYGGDTVEVRTHVDATSARVAVIDDGPGVPAAERDLIFEPYHRAHRRSGVTGSVGLGLTVSRRLARLMGGDVTYQREDGKTRFELSLPRAGAAETALGDSALPARSRS